MSTDVIPAPTPNGIAAPAPAGVAVASLLSGRPKIAAALAQAITSCHAVKKGDRNDYHKYNYASADAIIEEGRAALVGAGLALLPVEASLVGSERDGPDRYELVRTFVLLHTSGEAAALRVTWPVCPEKGRPLDKATAAADTLSLSYLLRDLLLMPRVDPSDDVSGRDDRPKQQPAPKASAARPIRKLPETGAQLSRWLGGLEARLVSDGAVLAGDLVKFVTQQVNQAGHTGNSEGWGKEAIALAIATAERYAQGMRQKALRDLLHATGTEWEKVRDHLKFPAASTPENLLATGYSEAIKLLRQDPKAQPKKTA